MTSSATGEGSIDHTAALAAFAAEHDIDDLPIEVGTRLAQCLADR
ncbi:hypothetical protein ACLMAJ_22100 [Nocardia sp. KC 131]